MAKGRVVIDEDRCKGCALCVDVCSHDVLSIAEERLNARGYHPARLIDPQGRCTGCGLCAVICPDVCITVYRQKATRPQTGAAANVLYCSAETMPTAKILIHEEHEGTRRKPSCAFVCLRGFLWLRLEAAL